MKFLFEEFFEKANASNSTTIISRIIIKLTFYLVIISVVAWIFYYKKYQIGLVLIGLILLAEAAHSIRKWRENVMTERHNQSLIKPLLKKKKIKIKGVEEK